MNDSKMSGSIKEEVMRTLPVMCYAEIAEIDADHEVFLVRHITSGRIGVRKRRPAAVLPVYGYLKKAKPVGIPRIYELCRENETLTVIEEFIPGRSLREYLKDHGPMKPVRAAFYTAVLASILEPPSADPPGHKTGKRDPCRQRMPISGGFRRVDLCPGGKKEGHKPSRNTGLCGTGTVRIRTVLSGDGRVRPGDGILRDGRKIPGEGCAGAAQDRHEEGDQRPAGEPLPERRRAESGASVLPLPAPCADLSCGGTLSEIYQQDS